MVRGIFSDKKSFQEIDHPPRPSLPPPYLYSKERNVLKMRENPCYKCDHRSVGCHGTCQDYILWKNDYDKEIKLARARRNGWNDRQR